MTLAAILRQAFRAVSDEFHFGGTNAAIREIRMWAEENDITVVDITKSTEYIDGTCGAIFVIKTENHGNAKMSMEFGYVTETK